MQPAHGPRVQDAILAARAFASRAFRHHGFEVFAWLDTQLAPDADTFDSGFGLAEIALITALDWMDFRRAFPTDGAPGLTRVRAAFRDHPSIASTVPRE
jgi:glutathione S-transferase